MAAEDQTGENGQNGDPAMRGISQRSWSAPCWILGSSTPRPPFDRRTHIVGKLIFGNIRYVRNEDMIDFSLSKNAIGAETRRITCHNFERISVLRMVTLPLTERDRWECTLQAERILERSFSKSCLRNHYYRRHKLSGAAKSTPYKVPQYGEAGSPYGQATVFSDENIYIYTSEHILPLDWDYVQASWR
jgi:hypothetical protein